MGNSSLEVAFPRVFRIARHKEAKVAEVMSHSPQGILWNLLFSRDLFEWEVELVGKLIDDLNLVYISRDGEDRWIWSPSSDGQFSSNPSFMFSSILICPNLSF